MKHCKRRRRQELLRKSRVLHRMCIRSTNDGETTGSWTSHSVGILEDDSLRSSGTDSTHLVFLELRPTEHPAARYIHHLHEDHKSTSKPILSLDRPTCRLFRKSLRHLNAAAIGNRGNHLFCEFSVSPEHTTAEHATPLLYPLLESDKTSTHVHFPVFAVYLR